MDLIEKWEKELKEFDIELDYARSISRNAVYRIVYVSGAIVGFSVTIASTKETTSLVNQFWLAMAWVAFIAVAGLGLTLNIVEARVKYVLAWRRIQPMKADYKTSLRLRDKTVAFLVFLYALLISPRSLFLCRDYSGYTKDLKEKRERQNAVTVSLANLMFNVQLFLESVFVGLFIFALIILVLSVI